MKEQTRINDLLYELVDLDHFEATMGLNFDDRDKRNVLKVELVNKMHWEAISWKQKAREKWIREGDKNSKFFHCLANHRRRANYVESFVVNNKIITGNEALQEAAKSHFQSLYTENVCDMPKLDHICFDKIGESERLLYWKLNSPRRRFFPA